MAGVKSATADWDFDAVTIGFPGLVEDGQLVREPLNLGGGWLDANLERAFDRPVRIINDAALQALASYEGGRMLFVGFGTSIGSALVADDTIVPVELGLIPFTRRATFKTRLTKDARKKSGHKRWQKYVHESVALLQDIFWPQRHGDRGRQCQAPRPAARSLPADDEPRRVRGRAAALGGKRPPRSRPTGRRGASPRRVPPTFFPRGPRLAPVRYTTARRSLWFRIEPMPIDIALTGLAMPLAEFPRSPARPKTAAIAPPGWVRPPARRRSCCRR